MKNQLIIYLIALVILACSSDDDADTPPMAENQAPESFGLLAIADEAEDISLKPTFSWEMAFDPDGDTIAYNFYLDGNSDPSTLITTIDSTDLTLESFLDYEQEYFWKVVAEDGNGGSVESDVFSFTTKMFGDVSQASADFSGRLGHRSVVFKDKIWVIGGNAGNGGGLLNDVWNNATPNFDKVNNAPFQQRWLHSALVYNDKIWVIGGNSGKTNNHKDVWSSEDGIFWNEELNDNHSFFSARYSHASAVFDDKMWLIGGFDGTVDFNDIWSSSDGITWTQVSSSAEFTPRRDAKLVAFQDKLWLIGGYYGAKTLDEIWFSEDGANWTQVTTPPAFGPRTFHDVMEMHGRLWLVAGFDGTTNVTDIWTSKDGLTWEKAVETAAFTSRRLHSIEFYDGKMVVIAGQHLNTLLSELWFYD